jgi:hypothetical protein
MLAKSSLSWLDNLIVGPTKGKHLKNGVLFYLVPLESLTFKQSSETAS